MSVLLLRGDQRANVDAILEAFGWRATGRSWAKDDPELEAVDAKHTHDQALVGLNFDHGWTVMHDTSVAFVDDTSVLPELARQLDTRAIAVDFHDNVGFEWFALATPGKLEREIQFADGELAIDEGEPLFSAEPDSDGESRFPEGSVLEMLDRELGRSHDDVVLVEDVTVLEIERLK
jgi:hypothetical protein